MFISLNWLLNNHKWSGLVCFVLAWDQIWLLLRKTGANSRLNFDLCISALTYPNLASPLTLIKSFHKISSCMFENENLSNNKKLLKRKCSVNYYRCSKVIKHNKFLKRCQIAYSVQPILTSSTEVANDHLSKFLNFLITSQDLQVQKWSIFC
jgi:hypothetical protein